MSYFSRKRRDNCRNSGNVKKLESSSPTSNETKTNHHSLHPHHAAEAGQLSPSPTKAARGASGLEKAGLAAGVLVFFCPDGQEGKPLPKKK